MIYSTSIQLKTLKHLHHSHQNELQIIIINQYKKIFSYSIHNFANKSVINPNTLGTITTNTPRFLCLPDFFKIKKPPVLHNCVCVSHSRCKYLLSSPRNIMRVGCTKLLIKNGIFKRNAKGNRGL